MKRQILGQLANSDYLKLMPVLALAFYVAFIPHIDYLYPVHLDEWIHLTLSKAMLQAGSPTVVEPFSGETTFGPSSNLEAGFQLFWGVFQAISGIPWMALFRYFPSIIFMITVASVYILARREGFGWEAAFFTSLIPTTEGLLGPAFLVPVSVGLLFTPLILFLAFNFRTVRSYLVLFLFIVFLLAIHPPSAIIPLIVLTPYIFLSIKGDFRNIMGLVLALLLPFLVIFPWVFNLLLPTARSLLTQTPLMEYVRVPPVVESYGYLPVLFCLVGAWQLGARGGKKNYGLILGLLTLLLMLVSFFVFHYGVPIMYYRGILYLMLVMSIVAGAGLARVKNIRLPAKLIVWPKVPLIAKNAGNFLCLALIGITLATGISYRLGITYYQMIDNEDYQAFLWIEDNVGEDYQKAMVDPWKATPFTAVTGRYVYTRIQTYPMAKDMEAYAFISGGSTNTTFLQENGLSLVYTRIYDWGRGINTEFSVDNPSLVEVRKNVYLLKEVEGK